MWVCVGVVDVDVDVDVDNYRKKKAKLFPYGPCIAKSRPDPCK